MSQPLVAFDRLSVSFQGEQGPVRAVQQVSLELQAGQTLGIVGESGCGKSVTAMALMGLLPQPLAQVDGGEIRFEGQNLLSLRASKMADLRGNRLAMIFQEPMSALNPVLTLGEQLVEPLIRHWPCRRKRPGSGGATAGGSGIGARGGADALLPASTVRWHAAARDDRHGDRMPPGAADRR